MSDAKQIRAKTRASLRFAGGWCERCKNRHRLEPKGESQFVKATNLHEVIRRGTSNKAKQAVLFMRGNCLFLCQACHEDAHGSDLFEWQIPLLLLERSTDEIIEFINAYRETFKIVDKVIFELEREVINGKDNDKK